MFQSPFQRLERFQIHGMRRNKSCLCEIIEIVKLETFLEQFDLCGFENARRGEVASLF